MYISCMLCSGKERELLEELASLSRDSVSRASPRTSTKAQGKMRVVCNYIFCCVIKVIEIR